MKKNHVETIRDPLSGELVEVVGTLKTLETGLAVNEASSHVETATSQGSCSITSYLSHPYVGWAGDWYASAYAYEEMSAGCESGNSNQWVVRLREDQGWWAIRDSASEFTHPGEKDTANLSFECGTDANEDWLNEQSGLNPYQSTKHATLACNG